jgi:methylglutaconyl-CoA hydratase
MTTNTEPRQYEHLLTRRDGPIEYLTLNRPGVRNALNNQTIAELTGWAEAVRDQRDVRAIVLSGSGKTFCAGADVAWMSRTIQYTEEQNLRDALAMSRMFARLDSLPIPLIGRVQGAALGGGAGLAAVCDVVVAEAQAQFGFTEVKLGIVPAVISPFVLAKIGRSAARELFLTGARFPASRAREIGLVHRVVDAGSLDATVAEVAREFLEAGPEAVAAAKSLLAQVWSRSTDAAAELTAGVIASRRVSSEGQEGLRAFLDKRTPSWRGPA